MNRRDFTHYAGEREKDALEVLRTPNVAVPDYQQAMRALGRTLGQIIPVDGQTLVVSTSEDADYLAKGCIESLKAREVAYKLAVFWNHHYTLPNGESIAPILNRYLQPGYRDCTRIILLKSIISGSCVIRTNLLALLATMPEPEKIAVAAPVMYCKGEESLRREFPPAIADKFTFYTFAVDYERDEKGNVLDGIGGDVYPHLGLADQPVRTGKPYMPQLVTEALFE